MVKTEKMKQKKPRFEAGSVPAIIALIISVISFILWAIYVPFTFLNEIVSYICLALVLPVSVFLIICGLTLSLIALNIGAGKRKSSAIIALIFCVLQVILWVGWIIFMALWNTNFFD